MTTTAPTSHATVLRLTPSRRPDRTLRYAPVPDEPPVTAHPLSRLRLVPVNLAPERVNVLGWVSVDDCGRESVDFACPDHALALDAHRREHGAAMRCLSTAVAV